MQEPSKNEKAELEEAVVVITAKDDFPLVELTLPVELTEEWAQKYVTLGLQKIDEVAGNPFGLLIDTRGVKKADEAALTSLQAFEMDAAGLGMERLAHVLPKKAAFTKERLAQLEKSYADLGFSGLIKTFFDVDKARIFLSHSAEVAA